MMIIFIIAVLVVLFIVWLKSYKLDLSRTITAYTGGVGAGKSVLAVRQAIKRYKAALREWKRKCFFARIMRKELPEKPLLFSNLPIVYKKKFTSCELPYSVLLLQERVPERSVIVIDEVSSFLNQFEYNKNTNVKLFDEFCRLCRHYFDGTVIITDQCSANIVLQIRRRLNTIYNLAKHSHFLFFFNTVRCREINISEEIVTIDEKDTNVEQKPFFYFGNFFKYYNSRAYAPRYSYLDFVKEIFHTQKTTEELLSCPDYKFPNVIEQRRKNPVENTLSTIDEVLSMDSATSQEGSATAEGAEPSWGTINNLPWE